MIFPTDFTMSKKVAKNAQEFHEILKSKQLSQCAEEYIACLADPFGATTGCLPAAILNIPSRKMKTYATGTLSTSSTTGTGFILVRPAWMAFAGSGGATINAVTFSNSSFTGTAFDNNDATTGVDIAQSNSEYLSGAVSTSVSSGIQYRLVACAIEVENTTPWSTRGGLATGVCEPNHLSLNGKTEPEISVLDGAFRESVSSGGNSKFTLKYNGPVEPGELDYSDSILNGAPNNLPFMGIWFSGPNSQTYMWRVVAHFEIVGTSARGKTATWSDPKGAGLGQTIMNKAHTEAGSQHHDSPGFWGTLSNALHTGVAATAEGAAKAAHFAVSAGNFITSLPGPRMLAKLGQSLASGYAGGAGSAAVSGMMKSGTKSIAAKSAGSVLSSTSSRPATSGVRRVYSKKPAPWKGRVLHL